MQAGAFVRRLARDSAGASLVEYTLLTALIAVGIIASVQGIASSQKAGWNALWTAVQNVV